MKIIFVFLTAILLATLPIQVEAVPLLRGEVVRVIDGDTIVVKNKGMIERVRLIGIDSPEVSNQKTGVAQCYSQAARQELLKLSLHKKVLLSRDIKNKNRDSYGRLLRYVFIDDTKKAPSLNAQLVRNGAARVYKRYQFEQLLSFEKEEKDAQGARRGLWKVCGKK